MQFTIDSWEERNSQVNSDKRNHEFKKRFKERDRNRDALEAPVRKCLDKILSIMEKRVRDQLDIKMEILRCKIKKEKKMRRAS